MRVDAAGAADEAGALLADGAALLAALSAAGANLARQAEAIDALNVFPVPDGDTGKNMTLTMQAALDAARAASPAEAANAGVLAARLARGAVMGSRGNSGVILSQILRGFARGLGSAERFGGAELATAFREATATAYRAVQQPVEGTMLTVIRAVADAAEATVAVAEAEPPGLLAVLDAGLAAAREALAHTPKLLPRLREAGVVDAGGQGVVALLEGAAGYAHGEAPGASEAVQPATASVPGGAVNPLADFLALHEGDEVGYCTNLLILPRPQERLAYALIRERVLALGESGVVIGDEELVKIHIHTEHPGLVLEEAVRWGELSQIRIDNMAAQVRAVTAEVQASAGGAPVAPVVSTPEQAPSAGPEVVAVASGDGLVAVLRSLGATSIVSGGQTMNPSTEELLRAVEAAPGDEVILLPNNDNVILTAEQVTGLTTKRVAIVPSRSVPQGIAALTAFNFDMPLDENLAAMTEALTATHSAEVTRAVRAATIDGLSVEAGQIIGLIDGKLSVAGDDMHAVLRDLLRRMDAASAELVTVYRGADVGEETARAMVESLAGHYPAATFELVDGGQPHYDYLLSVE